MSYYQYHVFFCTNQRPNGENSCEHFQAQAMRDYAKQRVKALGLHKDNKCRIKTAGCLNRCELGPVLVVYPEAVWYTYVDQTDIDEIIDSHLVQGQPVARLMVD